MAQATRDDLPIGQRFARRRDSGGVSVRLRSELTITPSPSAQSAPGSTISAWALVSVARKASCVITSSAASSPAITLARLATLATGLVQMIQQALIAPRAMSSNKAIVPCPVSARSVPGGRRQACSTNARSPAFSALRWPGSPAPM
jgi:hypothetical protein